MGVDSGHCLSKQQFKCSKPNTEFFEQFIDHFAPVIKSHSFSNYQANNSKRFYLNMELHTKQLQIGMNSAVAVQLCPGADPGGAIGAIALLKPTEVTFFTMILYNSERHLTAN